MFRESLKRVVESVEGGVAGLLMGFDGISVDQWMVPSSATDITTVGMEYSFVLGQVCKAAETLDAGGVVELTVRMERLTIVMRLVTQEYFLALAVLPGGNTGKGRYLLRVAAPELEREL
jgi:predicted regulator of Ras-like GTPase activity (Roadblock/LC7/MglB family)